MAFDFRSITDTVRRSLASAGLESGLMQRITATIDRSLAGAGLAPRPQPAGFEGRAEDEGRRDLPGEFVDETFSNHAGTRRYKMYIPAIHAREGGVPAPLVIMLHGCKQTPEDFARGTRMNEFAEQHGFLVAYPAQGTGENPSGCWNWFRHEDQGRDRGEPAILAGLAAEVTMRHRVDPRRVFVAGMSAGAAMAVVLAATYPDRFAAVGVHSGLPYGAAHDVPSAFRVMKNGSGSRNGPGFELPAIVFHGDADTTVNLRNAAAIVDQATGARVSGSEVRAHVTEGTSADGRGYRRTVYSDGAGSPVVEQWVISGAGHAWSGGDPRGSFTDAAGPDASAEMIRFFLSVREGGNA